MTSRQVQFRRGSKAQHQFFTGAIGEVTVVLDDSSLRVHDGSTVGGNPISIDGNLPAGVDGNIHLGGHLIPTSSGSFTIGSTTNKLKDLYLSASTLYLGDNTTLSGTSIVINAGSSPTTLSELPSITASTYIAKAFTYGSTTVNPSFQLTDNTNNYAISLNNGNFSFDGLTTGGGNIVANNINGTLNGNVISTNLSSSGIISLGNGNGSSISLNSGNNNISISSANIETDAAGNLTINGFNIPLLGSNSHTHSNKILLDLISTSGNYLYYNNLPIETTWGSITEKPTTLSGYGITDGVNVSQLGVSVATLDSNGTLPSSQLPLGLVQSLQYKGTWNATTNTPTLTSGTGTSGYMYKVSVSGSTTIDGISQWNVGDLLIFDGSVWDKIDGISSEVLSVSGRTGAITLSVSDVSGAAPLASPAFTGTPTAPTITSTDNSTSIATTAFVKNQNYITGTTISGDASGSGTNTITLTLANVNSNTGNYGSTSVVPVITVNSKGLITAASTATITPVSIGAVASSLIGVASGVASLDIDGKVPTSQLPPAVVGSLQYQGTWNASTNTPTLTSGTGTKGYMYKVSVAGVTTIDGISQWNIGDLLIFDGSVWDKIDGISSEIISVAGRTGAITLSISDISGAAPLASPALTGVPIAPTASTNTNTTQLATTAFVIGQASSATPLMNGVASSGIDTVFSRDDHVHPSDTTKANLISPTFSGVPVAPTAAINTNTTQIATTAFVIGQASSTTPTINGTAAIGSSTTFARADHVHPSDTTKANLASPTFTGSVNAPTVTSTDNSTSIATTAFVKSQNYITGTTITGDASGTGTNVITLTLASVNSNTGTYGSTSVVPVITVNGKGLITAASTAIITPVSIGAVGLTAVGVASGVASLDIDGKVPTSQLPPAVVGSLQYQGTWNASTNTPTLASGTGTKGYMYKVSISGSTTIDGISQWNVGDLLIFDGSVWDKIDGISSEIISVSGRTGAITLSVSDVSGAAPLASPALTGVPTAPTITSTDNSTSIATTAFVKNQSYITISSVPVASSTTPTMNGTAAIGSGTTWARADHVHPSDTTKANLASPTFTGSVNAPTVTSTDNSTSIATTAFVKNQNYLTGNQTITLSGDISGSGSTAITLTLPAINSNVGTWNNLTVNAKGQVTAGSNISYLTTNQTITLSGDITGSGNTSIAGTLATVNTNTGTWGSSVTVPVITVNGKGLVTAVSNASITPSAIGAAPLASPAFTGTPTAPTPSGSDNSTSIATTAWVKSQGYGTGGGTITVSGDASGSGTSAITLTLASVNSNTGSYGTTSVVPVITVNGKGLVTAVSTATITPSAIGAAPLASPAFTGTPTAPTITSTDNSTSIATTAFVKAQLNNVNTWTAAQISTITSLTYATTITPNFALSNDYSITLTGNATLANPTNLVAGQSGHIMITQDTTGSRTMAYGSYWKWGNNGTPTLSTTASAKDVISYWVADSTHIIATIVYGVQ